MLIPSLGGKPTLHLRTGAPEPIDRVHLRQYRQLPYRSRQAQDHADHEWFVGESDEASGCSLRICTSGAGQSKGRN